MKTGRPIGWRPSRRIFSGASKPASTLPRRRVSPARPESPSVARIVRTLRHSLIACPYAGPASGKGPPGPDGSEARFFAQPGRTPIDAQHTSATASRTRHGIDLTGLQPGPGVLDLLLDARAVDRFAVAVEGTLPRRRGIGEPLLLEAQIAEVILDHRVVRHLRRGLAERRVREIELALLVIGPPQAVEKRGIARLELQRALDQIDGLVQALAALGEHVAEIVERGRVRRIPREDLAQRPFGALEVPPGFEHLCKDVHAAGIVGGRGPETPRRLLGAGQIARLPLRGRIEI